MKFDMFFKFLLLVKKLVTCLALKHFIFVHKFLMPSQFCIIYKYYTTNITFVFLRTRHILLKIYKIYIDSTPRFTFNPVLYKDTVIYEYEQTSLGIGYYYRIVPDKYIYELRLTHRFHLYVTCFYKS